MGRSRVTPLGGPRSGDLHRCESPEGGTTVPLKCNTPNREDIQVTTQMETRKPVEAHSQIGEVLEKLDAAVLADPAIEEIVIRHADAWAECADSDDETLDEELDASCLGIVDVLEEMDWLATRSTGANDALIEVAAELLGNGYTIEELPDVVLEFIG